MEEKIVSLRNILQDFFGTKIKEVRRGPKFVSMKVLSSSLLLNDEETSNKLIEENIRLSYFVAGNLFKKYSGFFTYDELSELCLFGLVKAGKSFNESKGYKFATFATRVMTNEVLMELRKHKQTKQFKDNVLEISLDSKIPNQKDSSEQPVHEIIEDTKAQEEFLLVEEKVYGNPLEQFLSYYFKTRKNEREKEIVREMIKLILNDEDQKVTQRDIGNKLNLSQSYISRVKKSLRRQYRVWKEINFT